ncbi:retinitis pigmentosa 9 protein homolog [Uloborus diversus]|uniref:retinitis pigmentosa 9 protein homolog n=1 Tax=Uloborus diversus TaxID=327109 RepID=UPI0024091F47|nr:retinitis pigmentosa 9 protein homolog [Uloborus diversus]XP_054720002.1 retinitis pigmentosa 9 protein homolog [Uloborus diversus]
MASCSKERKSSKKKKKGRDEDRVQVLKHYDTFYSQAPPGLVKEEEERPEDCIPDLPENKDAREFLSRAPTKGLWMPLGKEVKVMKCWRCKTYGHRTGDRECPLFVTGNKEIEKFRFIHEDPMHNFISEKQKAEKLERVEQLRALLASSDSSSSSSSSDLDSESEKRKRKRKKKSRHKHKKRKKHK